MSFHRNKPKTLPMNSVWDAEDVNALTNERFAGWYWSGGGNAGEEVPTDMCEGYALEFYFEKHCIDGKLTGQYIYEGPDSEGIEPRFFLPYANFTAERQAVLAANKGEMR